MSSSIERGVTEDQRRCAGVPGDQLSCIVNTMIGGIAGGLQTAG
jgi:hypothetical protein